MENNFLYNKDEETVDIKNGKLQFTFDVSYDDDTPPIIKEFLQGLKTRACVNDNQYKWYKNMEAAYGIKIPATKIWKLNESASYSLEI